MPRWNESLDRALNAAPCLTEEKQVHRHDDTADSHVGRKALPYASELPRDAAKPAFVLLEPRLRRGAVLARNERVRAHESTRTNYEENHRQQCGEIEYRRL